MTSKIIAVVVAAAGLSLAAAAGSPAAASSQRPAAGHMRAGGPPAHAGRRHTAVALPADGTRVFGAGCAILPRHGPASKAALAAAPVAAAISREPGLTELAHALQLTGLARALDSAGALTVFAPDNAAFHSLGADNLQALLATRADLVRVLKFHVVTGRVSPAQLVRHHVVATAAGTKIHVFRAGKSLGVNNATVTCGNVQTANATVYVVNRLVVPAG